MNFGQALELLNEGKRVAREGWNGKGMWIYKVSGKSVPIDRWGVGRKYTDSGSRFITQKERQEGYVTILPHIDMHTADGKRCIGWLASQTDMLANDWMVIE